MVALDLDDSDDPDENARENARPALTPAPKRRGRPPTRTLEAKSFQSRVSELQLLARAGRIGEEHSFWGRWPADSFERIDVDPAEPLPGMRDRAAALHSFLARTFASCTGVYVGKTTNPRKRFNLHRSKRRGNEAVVMIGLWDFANEKLALVMEKRLSDDLLRSGVPQYDREDLFGGKGRVRGEGPGETMVYAVMVVGGPP